MNTDGSFKSTVKINGLTANGPSNLTAFNQYGTSVATIGDVHGDGGVDLAVGGSGEVYVHLMNADASVKSTVKINGLTANGPRAATPTWDNTAGRDNTWGWAVFSLGDVDGDGVPDLGTDGFIVFLNADGSPKSTRGLFNNHGSPPDWAVAAASIGDLNGDGRQEIAVGDGTWNDSRGAVFILSPLAGTYNDVYGVPVTAAGALSNLAVGSGQADSILTPIASRLEMVQSNIGTALRLGLNSIVSRFRHGLSQLSRALVQVVATSSPVQAQAQVVKHCYPQGNACASDADCGGTCFEGACQPPPLAYPSHWSYGGNTDDTGLGWVDWSLAESDWIPPLIKQVIRPEGIYEPSAPPPPELPAPGSHPPTFTVIAKGVYAPQDYMIRCDVTKSNGEKVVLGEVFSDGSRLGTNETFSYVIPAIDDKFVEGVPSPSDPIRQNDLWYLEGCLLGMEPPAGPSCSRDSDCSPGMVCDAIVPPAAGTCRPGCSTDLECLFGQVCDAMVPGGTGICRDVAFRTGRKPIYTHRNTWNLFNLNEDFYQAVKCYTKFEGEFFQNAGQCDFRGDATFSMAMNKGIPIERNCVNGIDDDGNGLTDCQDPFCRSLAVTACIRHPALECDFQAATGGIGQCQNPLYRVGDLCCTRQNRVVNGMECAFKDPDDGYFDCDCIPDEFGNLPADLGPDCGPASYVFGDLCCTANSQVIKAGVDENDVDLLL
jgi:hypothetical protein